VEEGEEYMLRKRYFFSLDQQEWWLWHLAFHGRYLVCCWGT